MANSSLEDKYFTPPDKVLNKIESALAKIDVEKRAKGFQRAKEILTKKVITYAQMKRLKNYFDSYEGDGFDDEFKLIGGYTMQKWVDKALGTSRDAVHDVKQTRMDAGEENQFKRTHEKDKDNADPTNVRMVKVHKGSKLRNIMSNNTIYEELTTIKKLIDYMN